MKKRPFCSRFSRVFFQSVCLILGACLSGGARSAWADQVYVDSPLRIQNTGTNTVVHWQLPTECSTNLVLQCASDPGGPWTTITNAPEPFVVANPTNRFYRTSFALPGGGPDEAEIIQLVRDYAFSSISNLNPSIQFDIRIEPVRDLWEELGVQVCFVFKQGSNTPKFSCFIHEGAVMSPYRWPFDHLGGGGLRSGFVHGESFYYTYAEGSGILYALVGKLQIVNGKMKTWHTDGITNDAWWLRLYLSRENDGSISVKSGRPWTQGGFESFNWWYDSEDFGWIDESDSESTKLRGMDGSVIATFMPVLAED